MCELTLTSLIDVQIALCLPAGNRFESQGGKDFGWLTKDELQRIRDLAAKLEAELAEAREVGQNWYNKYRAHVDVEDDVAYKGVAKLEAELAVRDLALEMATAEMVAEDNKVFQVPRDPAWWVMLARFELEKQSPEEAVSCSGQSE